MKGRDTMELFTEPIHVVGIGGTQRAKSTSLWALEHALRSAEAVGATTELLSLRDYKLPLYEPGKPLDAYGSSVERFVEAARRADAFIWSTAGYHGTIVGATKNALDFLEFLADDARPYLHQRVVGLIATAGGELAAVNAVNAMVHVVHALRGTAVPLFVAIPQAKQVFDPQGRVLNQKWAERLDQLGKLVVETASQSQAANLRSAEA